MNPRPPSPRSNNNNSSSSNSKLPKANEYTMSAAINGTAPQTSGVTPSLLQQKLLDALGPTTEVEIEDLSGGCGQMFQATIISPLFAKKTSLARHRLVNAALRQEVAAIHAWTPKCYTPEEWEARKGQ